MKRIFLFLFLIFVFSPAYVYPQEKPPRKVSFIPHWSPQAQFAGYFVAYEKGFYRKYGLDVDILQGGEEVSCPFDKRRNGVILGEGAGVVVLENEESARKRGARVYAKVSGSGWAFDSFRSGKFHPQAKGLKSAYD